MGPEGACGAAVTPPFGLSITNDVVADCAPAFTVAVAVPAQLGVIANWASRASAVATIELRPVHPPTVTVNSTFACRAKPVASSDTAESVRSLTTTAGAAGTAGTAAAAGTAGTAAAEPPEPAARNRRNRCRNRRGCRDRRSRGCGQPGPPGRRELPLRGGCEAEQRDDTALPW